MASFSEHYAVRGGGKIQALEDEPPKGYIVVIAFDSAEKAREWYDSPAYAAIRPIRPSSTKRGAYVRNAIVGNGDSIAKLQPLALTGGIIDGR